MTKVPQQKINDLELTVRTIESIVPDMPTKSLQKWQGILRTALLKVEKELTATTLHVCVLCFSEEWGYRDELPTSWFQKGDSAICFSHTYDDAEKELAAMGNSEDAAYAPELAPVTVESLKVHMDNNLPAPKTDKEDALQDLMDLI